MIVRIQNIIKIEVILLYKKKAKKKMIIQCNLKYKRSKHINNLKSKCLIKSLGINI